MKKKEQNSNKPTILCVDDELIILATLKQQLQNYYGDEFTIEAVASAESALEIVTHCNINKIDLPIVICDILMPSMKGDDLLIQINKTNPETKKILLTGYSSSPSIANVVNNANLFKYITKPWVKKDLLESLDGALKAFYDDQLLLEKTIELEKNLHVEEVKYKNLVEQMSGAIYVMTTDANKDVLFHSPQTLQITGFSKEEFSYTLWINQIHPEDRELVVNKFETSVTTEESFTIEYRFHRKDGETIWIEEIINILYKDKSPFLFQGMRNDITNRKVAEEKLKIYAGEIEMANQKLLNAFDQAEKANKSKSQFLADITHEFSTPLNSILGYCQLFELGQLGTLTEKQSKIITYIHESGNHLLALVHTILDFSKIEAGRVIIRKENFDLSKLVKEIIHSQEAIANEKKIKIELETDNSDCTIFADRTRMKQVLINLCSNAIKFTQNNKSIGFKIKSQSGNLILKCWDEGIGIPLSDQKRIFEPFEQIRNDFTMSTKGTGLGLSIVKSILDLHGFSIHLDSEELMGTTFTITMTNIS